MRFAYADPPYLGCAKKFYGDHPEAAVYDTLDGHRALIERLSAEFPDGWAYSLHTPSLRQILAICPEDVRVCAWVKPFCSFKPGVKRAFGWEPILVRGGRKINRDALSVRDWVSCSIATGQGLRGAKPPGVLFWLFDFLGMQPQDEFHDLFPGSGAVTRAWESWRSQGAMAFGGEAVASPQGPEAPAA